MHGRHLAIRRENNNSEALSAIVKKSPTYATEGAVSAQQSGEYNNVHSSYLSMSDIKRASP